MLSCTLFTKVEIQGADGEVLGLRPCGEVLALKPKDTARWGHGGLLGGLGSVLPVKIHVGFKWQVELHDFGLELIKILQMLHDFFILFFLWLPSHKSLPT